MLSVAGLLDSAGEIIAWLVLVMTMAMAIDDGQASRRADDKASRDAVAQLEQVGVDPDRKLLRLSWLLSLIPKRASDCKLP